MLVNLYTITSAREGRDSRVKTCRLPPLCHRAVDILSVSITIVRRYRYTIYVRPLHAEITFSTSIRDARSNWNPSTRCCVHVAAFSRYVARHRPRTVGSRITGHWTSPIKFWLIHPSYRINNYRCSQTCNQFELRKKNLFFLQGDNLLYFHVFICMCISPSGENLRFNGKYHGYVGKEIIIVVGFLPYRLTIVDAAIPSE